MRGLAFRCETLSAHFVCPSCSRRIANDNRLNGSPRLFGSSKGSSRPKAFSTRTRPLVSREKLARPRWGSPSASMGTRSSTESVPPNSNHSALDFGSVTEPGTRQEESTVRFQYVTDSRLDTIMEVLAVGEPESVMDAFLDPANYKLLYRSLSTPAFIEAFCRLSPAYFIEPYKDILARFRLVVVEMKGHKQLKTIFQEFSHKIATIANLRREAGYRLGLAEYTHILDCARSMGDAQMADDFWADMKLDGIKPNLECYNFYMEAKVWHNTYPLDKSRLRTIPFHYKKRTYQISNDPFEGFKTGPGGLRDQIVALFNDMRNQGIQGDEATFVNVMISSSREGNMNGVKDILKAVWNINVDQLLLEGDRSSAPAALTPYAPSSPLRPTTRLLYAVAHMFCTNNDFSTGLEVVDLISREYDIPIPNKVWMELLEWSYILSMARFGPAAEQNLTGSIPYDTVMNVFQTMTSAPYNIAPTIEMYDIAVKAHRNGFKLPETLNFMRKGHALFERSLKRRDEAAVQILKIQSILYTKQQGVGKHPKLAKMISKQRDNLVYRLHSLARPQPLHLQHSFFFEETGNTAHPPARYYTATRAYHLAQLTLARDTALIEGWVRLILGRRWGNFPRWQRRVLPGQLLKWREFLPLNVWYSTYTGKVRFESTDFWKLGVKSGIEEYGELKYTRPKRGVVDPEFERKIYVYDRPVGDEPKTTEEQELAWLDEVPDRRVGMERDDGRGQQIEMADESEVRATYGDRYGDEYDDMEDEDEDLKKDPREDPEWW